MSESKSKRDPLDQALSGLARDVQPERDLWPDIRAQIADDIAKTPAAPGWHGGASRWFQLAAAVLLVVATSLTTYFITRESLQQSPTQVAEQSLPTPQLTVQPAGFDFGPEMLGPEYIKTRAQLDQEFKKHVASLPPATRAKVERNLAELRHAAAELSATLKEHPSDPLLQQLLMSTYQSELQLLANVSDMAPVTSTRIDL